MDQKEIFEKIKKIANEIGIKNPEKLTPETRLKEDMEFDSLDHITLQMAIEEEFNLYLQESDTKHIRTVGEILNFIGARLKDQPKIGQTKEKQTMHGTISHALFHHLHSPRPPKPRTISTPPAPGPISPLPTGHRAGSPKITSQNHARNKPSPHRPPRET
jgi:acyl carrier protein